MSGLPAGFRPHFRSSPATAPWEPLYSRTHEQGVELLFEVRTAHCNGRGTLHGGVLSALCDNAMGLSVGTALESELRSHAEPRAHPSPQIVTVSLTVDFVSSAQVGDTVLITPRVLRAARGVSFCDALVTRGDGSVIARASASFRVRTDAAPRE